MSGLLSGIRVVELGSLLNADNIGMLLGDQGADVIKVERPGTGDYLRYILGQITPGNSPAHLQFNRNKRSLTLNLTGKEGRDVFMRIVATTDVVVDGNLPRALDKLQLGYDALRACKPDLIYCACTGYGATGPYASIPTHGMMMNALAGCVPAEMGSDGFMHIMPYRGLGGMQGGGAGPSAAAPHAAYAIAAALIRRMRTGQGARLDVAGSEAVIMGALNAATLNLNEHRLISGAKGDATMEAGVWNGSRYQFYETRDGKSLLFGAIEPKFWERFCVCVGREDLLDLPADTENKIMDYGDDNPKLRLTLQAIFRTRSLDQWLSFANEQRIPICSAPLNVVEASKDPQMQSRAFIFEGTHPQAGQFTYVGSPARVDEDNFEVRIPAPSLGEHTSEVLAELGYNKEEIAVLRERGAV